MRRHEHPRPDLLLRFLRCELLAEERRSVVRHLLTGCLRCVAITRPVWHLTDRPMQPKDSPEG
jgi:hypothetical protein